MFSKYFTILLMTICAIVHLVNSQGYYTIVGSKQIYPNADYVAAVTVHNIASPCKIRLSVQNNNTNYSKSKEINMISGKTELVKISTGDMTSGDGGYTFIAEGLSGIQFRDEQSINLNIKTCSILIQIDKSLYKPRDFIKWRIILIDQFGKPIVNLKDVLEVNIMETNSALIKQWTTKKTFKGVFSNKLQLPDSPVIGNWKIAVKYLNQTKNKIFEVDEYISPNFEVNIEAARNQLYSNSFIRASVSVRSMRKYSNPFTGEIIVKISHVSNSTIPLLTKTLKLENNKVSVEFNIFELRLFNQIQRDLLIRAEFTDRSINEKQSADIVVTLHNDIYKISHEHPSKYYYPELPFEFIIKVTNYDNIPVTDKTNKLSISYGGKNDPRAAKHVEYHTIHNGVAVINLIVPSEFNGIYVFAKYIDKEISLGYFSKINSTNNVYLQATEDNQRHLESSVGFRVESTEPLTNFTYVVLNRGKIIYSDSVIAKHRRYSRLTFFTNNLPLVPDIRIIVYYLKEGQIVTTHVDINNIYTDPKIELSVSDNKVNTGGSMLVTVSTKPGSFVGLSSIDRSNLITDPNFGFTENDIYDDLKGYGRDYGKTKDDVLPNYYQEFFTAGAFILSNAKPSIVYQDKSNAVLNVGSQYEPVGKKFPDSWIWNEITDSDTGVSVVNVTVPDHISSWLLTGFSINEMYGIKTTYQPLSIDTMFPKFFASLELPYSVKVGESVLIRVIIFNFMSDDFLVNATIHNVNGEFDFDEPSAKRSRESQKFRTKMVNIKSNHQESVSFLIKPKMIGSIAIKISAITSIAIDVIEKSLNVVPEGIATHKNEVKLIECSILNIQVTEIIIITIPPDIVPGSIHIEISITSEIMSNVIDNLDNLIQLPTGCGEQVMMNFVPCVVVLDYLISVDILLPEVRSKAIQFMEIGYQKELQYLHPDGSFSAFGKLYGNGSTWLTAYVVRSFSQAKKYMTIDATVLERAIVWLVALQKEDGSFPEVGKIAHESMQSQAGRGVALTAFVLVAILEHKDNACTYRSTIEKAIHYLVNNSNTTSLYDLALITYALQLAGDKLNGMKYYRRLLERVTEDDNKKWWNTTDSVNAIDIEITSYGLLCTILNGNSIDSLPIGKWLLSKRNKNGGFISTQDTVVGITALAAFAKFLSSYTNNISIELKYENEVNQLYVTNATVRHLLPNSVREISVSATGEGFALIEVSYQYNEIVPATNLTVPVQNDNIKFTLIPKIIITSNGDNLTLSICVSYKAANKDDHVGMGIMEIQLPSGYSFDLSQFETIKQKYNVNKIEAKNGNTESSLYFNDIGATEICLTINIYRTHVVANLKPVPVKVYDYYAIEQTLIEYYELPMLNNCEICKDFKC